MNRKCIIFNDNYTLPRRIIGAYRIASILEKLNWKTDVIEFTSLWEYSLLFDYLDKVVDDDTYFFGFSFTFMDAFFTKQLIQDLKERYPNRKYIIGGRQFYQQDLDADIYIWGYAEFALPVVIKWLFDGGERPKGFFDKNLNNSFVINCREDYPAANFKDYRVFYKDNDHIQPYEALSIELSRGCMFSCKFCDFPFLNLKEDTSTPAKLLRSELMENWERWRSRNYIITDSTVNDRMSKLEMLAEVVESLPFKPNFSAFVRFDLVVSKPRQIDLLIKSRLWGHFYGIETLNRDAGKSIGKGMDPERIKNGLIEIRKKFLDAIGLYRGTISLISGLPHETEDSWHRTEEWLEENWINEHWFWWYLQITNDGSQPSDISKNWSGYGYRPIATDDMEKTTEEFRQLRLPINPRIDEKIFLWEADWANIFDAARFAVESRKNEYRRKVSSFYIQYFVDKFSDQDLLNASAEYSWDAVSDMSIIKPYIDGKFISLDNR